MCKAVNTIEFRTSERQPETKHYRENTYMIVSKIAYLIGVKKELFDNEHESPKIEWYEKLKIDKNARIIRNLCMLRTAIERNFSAILSRMTYDLKNLNTMPDLVPVECIKELTEDGICIIKANYKPAQYIIDINRLINDRINNCKDLFPIWLNWNYVKELFIMPNGLCESGIRAAASEYYAKKNSYPYQVYINWSYYDNGNILYCDQKFIDLLYESHGDRFTDRSKVSDAGEKTKSQIYDYLDSCKRAAMIVDCENSDPYKLYATLNNLDQNALLDKIAKVILFDDVHAASAWQILDRFTDLEIEHIMLERVKDDKSYLDVQLTARACKEFYKNDIDSFILVSSDSDYWGLVSELEEARFFVMVEHRKCSPAIKKALENKGVTYCYIDDFNTGNSNAIKESAIIDEVYRAIDEQCCFNINDILESALVSTRAELTDVEFRQFWNKYVKNMRLVIDDDGEVYVQLGE